MRDICVVVKDPADVRVPKTILFGRVQIIWFVGITMVVSMITRPPDHTPLAWALCQHGEYKCKYAAGFEASMREVPMIARSDTKHTHEIQHDTAHDGFEGEATDKCSCKSGAVYTPKTELA